MKIDSTKYLIYGLFALLLMACDQAEDGVVSDESENDNSLTDALIYRNSQYSVELFADIVYAEGITHHDWNRTNPVNTSLLLDIYLPNNSHTLRPAMVFIHGGGFSGGDKQHEIPAYMPRYFAERGFVGISINYRLLGDFGSIPNELNAVVDALPDLNDDDRNQIKAMYPATRDAKAALRWVVANAEQYGIDPDAVSVIGGSAGAFIAIALGASESEDFTRELSTDDDPSLLTTHLDMPVDIKAVVDFWGGAGTMNLLNEVYQINRWDESDTPLCIIHGTLDATVPFESAEELVDLYEMTGAYYEFYPLSGAGHGAWGTVIEGAGTDALSFDFIARVLELDIVEN